MKTPARWVFFSAVLLLAGAALAQRAVRSRVNTRASRSSADLPRWENAPGFEKDVFTFVRVQYSSHGGSGWSTDYPDADLNLSYRLQQMTSMKVAPEGRVLQLEDPELFRYPFIYIVEPGYLVFSEAEVAILRRYLLNGGFLMVDDFWGEAEWRNLARELKRVFPDRQITDIPRTHAIFHSVFDIPNDLNLQLPAVHFGTASQFNGGITWERDDAQVAHFRGIYDDKGRLCVFISHNSDNGDGWEREGENEYYFREFAEKKAYPLGINVIFHAMTH
ncbi:MAG TPA: DUF4159 domain-containing protein [Chthoniobacteraceae bacterium]|jgi:hypothetical protein